MYLKQQSLGPANPLNSWPLYVSAFDALNDYTWQTPSRKSPFKCKVQRTNNKYYEILTIQECIEK